MYDISADRVAAEVTQGVYEQALELSRVLGVRIGKPRKPKIERDVKVVVRYARGEAAKMSNDEILDAMNAVILTLTSTCYPPATPLAREIFDRKAGEAQTEIELALLAARARWDIELGLDVPIRWLAALGGIAVKTARNLASAGQLSTMNKREGQVTEATVAARWLMTRGVKIKSHSRFTRTMSPKARNPIAGRHLSAMGGQ